MKNNQIKILIAASEVTPIAKVGGLGDVIGALPKALAKLNLDARVIMPFYGVIDRKKYKINLIKSDIKVGLTLVNLWQTTLPDSKVLVYLIEHKYFFGDDIYGNALANSKNDINKFIFFSEAILACLKAIDFMPDVFHLNDWHVAFIASLIKIDPFFKQSKSLLTIHNLANQGKIKGKNYLAEGLVNADIINTVSSTYAQEILTKNYGAGLEKILLKRKSDLYGILNGIDTDFFNPKTDKLIKYNFSDQTIENRTTNKQTLRLELGFPTNKNKALVGMVTRFTSQKGIELIKENLSELNCQFVMLGTGEKKYETILTALAKKFPQQFKVLIKFDEQLAHKIYAGADIFLVPSRFEPCGLTQMIAMRYGSVPLVRLTGGLADTVDSQVGFTFKNFSSAEFYKTLATALKLFYSRPATWRALQFKGMKKDFSWKKSAEDYLKLYQKLLKS